MSNITVIIGDITKLQIDAIVNAANTSLLGGGGVDGAIHRAAGRELIEACRLLNGCKVGEAKLTSGFRLPAKFIIHTVGPVWYGGNSNEKELLYNAYHNSLLLAVANDIRTIAFPNISTGVYHFPKQLAAEIAINAIKVFCVQHPDKIEEIIFVCFEQENYNIYKTLLQLNIYTT